MTKEFEKYYNFVKAHFSVTDIMHTEEGYCFWALEGAKDVQYVDGECIMRYVQQLVQRGRNPLVIFPYYPIFEYDLEVLWSVSY